MVSVNMSNLEPDRLVVRSESIHRMETGHLNESKAQGALHDKYSRYFSLLIALINLAYLY